MAYFITTDVVPSSPPGSERERRGWDTLNVTIWNGKSPDDPDKKRLGKYERNYSTMYNTFLPFSKAEKDFALYSPNYDSTRIMKLPECEDIGGEDINASGFCPVDYYIPKYEGDEEINKNPQWGLVAGCTWGDDAHWKVQFLDLSQVDNGLIKRDDRFGYINLPSGVDLKDAVHLIFEDDGEALLEIATPYFVRVKSNGSITDRLGYLNKIPEDK